MQMIADYPREWKQIVARYTSTSDLMQKAGHCQAHLSESDNLQKRRRIATDGVHPQPVLQTCIVCEPTRPTPRSESPSESVFPKLLPESAFSCGFCTKSYASKKALLQHQRVSHSVRNPFVQIVGESLECPVCHKAFANRWRVIAHLSETRQRRVGGPAELCGPKALEAPRLDPGLAQKLAESDRSARTKARRAGHSHAVVGRAHANKRTARELVVVPTLRLRAKTAEQQLIARKAGRYAVQAEDDGRSAKRQRR